MCRGCKLREGLVARAHVHLNAVSARLDEARRALDAALIDTAGPEITRAPRSEGGPQSKPTSLTTAATLAPRGERASTHSSARKRARASTQLALAL